MGNNPVVLFDDLVRSFRKAGLCAGDSVIVHTSLSSLGYVCGGAQTVIEALMAVVGSDGSIVMPTQSWKNLDPSTGVHWEIAPEQWDTIRANWPAYDKALTPTNTMGAVAEMFRQWPGVLRSDHPARSFAAWGRHAEGLIQNHDLRDIFGETSPLAKLYALDAKVLLIGVSHDKNTSLHLADVRAEYPGKHNVTEYSAMLVQGQRQWVGYETLYVDGEDFEAIGRAFEASCPIGNVPLGSGRVRCMRQRQLVDFAVGWMERCR